MNKFRVDDKVRRLYYNYGDDMLVGNVYTVDAVNESGSLIGVRECYSPTGQAHFDARNFELVEPEASPAKSEAEIVKAWFDKLKWLDDNTQIATFGGFLSNEMEDTYNLEDSVDFVINSYEAYQSEAKQKAKQELLDKKAKLELELAQINEQLGE
jgi:hypothetical protein